MHICGKATNVMMALDICTVLYVYFKIQKSESKLQQHNYTNTINTCDFLNLTQFSKFQIDERCKRRWGGMIDEERLNHIYSNRWHEAPHPELSTGTKYTIGETGARYSRGSSPARRCHKNEYIDTILYMHFDVFPIYTDGASDESLFTASRLVWAIVNPLKTGFSSTNCGALKPAFEALLFISMTQVHMHYMVCLQPFMCLFTVKPVMSSLFCDSCVSDVLWIEIAIACGGCFDCHPTRSLAPVIGWDLVRATNCYCGANTTPFESAFSFPWANDALL